MIYLPRRSERLEGAIDRQTGHHLSVRFYPAAADWRISGLRTTTRGQLIGHPALGLEVPETRRALPSVPIEAKLIP